MLYVDIPTHSQLKRLIGTRADACVSIYVPTTPETQHVGASRIAFANLAKRALHRLDDSKFDKRRRALIEAELEALREDDSFWRLQANSLAVLATADDLRTFRLATSITDVVEVADRFYIKPLLRSLAFPQHAYVLALSENSTRLVEIFPNQKPSDIKGTGLPPSAADAVGRASLNNLTQNTRIANDEGQTILLRQYARKVDAALSHVMADRATPLILAATSPLAAIFRGVSTQANLLDEGIIASPEHMTDAALADASRNILDNFYAREVEAAKARYEARAGQDRATTDLSRAARAATFGAVEQLLVDIDHTIPGSVDEADGTVRIASKSGFGTYDIIDEIAARAITTGAKVLAVRSSDLPGRAPVAAILRYAI